MAELQKLRKFYMIVQSALAKEVKDQLGQRVVAQPKVPVLQSFLEGVQGHFEKIIRFLANHAESPEELLVNDDVHAMRDLKVPNLVNFLLLVTVLQCHTFHPLNQVFGQDCLHVNHIVLQASVQNRLL